MPNFFAQNLLEWHQNHPRPLPWADGTRNPYHIWLSEIIMQQTRIEQGTSYYLRFVQKYPTLYELSAATLDEVMQLWEGLGYYNRARNMHKAARYIVDNLDGIFPGTYDGLLVLPGIGPYSAAAISSFAYGHEHVVVDGNVKRVVSRFAGITGSIDTPKTHEQIRQIASRYLKGVPSGLFNQALMNLGALVCKPTPVCNICPLSKKCFAYQHGLTSALPVRDTKKEIRIRFFHFIVIQYRGNVLLCKREQKDIWRGLYSFPQMERTSVRSPGNAQLSAFVSSLAGHHNKILYAPLVVYEQILSHQKIIGRFHMCRLLARPRKKPDDCLWVPLSDMGKYGKPGIIVRFLSHHLNQ